MTHYPVYRNCLFLGGGQVGELLLLLGVGALLGNNITMFFRHVVDRQLVLLFWETRVVAVDRMVVE